jgi:hypothetical protein
MGNQFASQRKAIALCDVCGFQYKLSVLRIVVRKGESTNIKACNQCWDRDHPQLKLGEFPVNDPQALRDPRPDNIELPQVRAIIIPATPVICSAVVRTVTVSTL